MLAGFLLAPAGRPGVSPAVLCSFDQHAADRLLTSPAAVLLVTLLAALERCLEPVSDAATLTVRSCGSVRTTVDPLKKA